MSGVGVEDGVAEVVWAGGAADQGLRLHERKSERGRGEEEEESIDGEEERGNHGWNDGDGFYLTQMFTSSFTAQRAQTQSTLEFEQLEVPRLFL